MSYDEAQMAGEFMIDEAKKNARGSDSLHELVQCCASCEHAGDFDDEGTAICFGGNTPRYDDTETNYVCRSDGKDCRFYKALNVTGEPSRKKA